MWSIRAAWMARTLRARGLRHVQPEEFAPEAVEFEDPFVRLRELGFGWG